MNFVCDWSDGFSDSIATAVVSIATVVVSLATKLISNVFKCCFRTKSVIIIITDFVSVQGCNLSLDLRYEVIEGCG